MSNEAEKDPKQQEQQKQDPTNRPQDISKKNPSQDSDPQNQGQEKPEDQKRRAS
jgi:hypothetical protein